MSRSSVRGERGVSLIEVMIALAILSTVLLSLSGLTWQMGRQARNSGASSVRSGALESMAATAHGAPWDSLPSLVGCWNDSLPQLKWTQCLEVQTVSPQLRQVRAIVIPTSPATLKPETLTVSRTRPRRLSTLNVQ